MTGWYAERMPNRSGRAMIALTVLALILVAILPLALLAGVIMMILGHVVGGLAVFGGSVLVATLGVALAGLSGLRRLRKLVSERSFPVVRLDGTQYTEAAEPEGSEYTNVVQLDPSDYSDVR